MALAPIEATLLPATFEGVAVRELTPLIGAVTSCFVGDLVGDLAMLEGRDVLGTGLGLGAFILILRARFGSSPVPRAVIPEPPLNMLGLPPAGFLAGGAAVLAGC